MGSRSTVDRSTRRAAIANQAAAQQPSVNHDVIRAHEVEEIAAKVVAMKQ
jgi:hypothetical protein